MVTVTAMNGLEKQAAFYRAYLTDDRSAASVAVVLAVAVALWLLLYLISLVGPYDERRGAQAVARTSAAAVKSADR